MSSFSLTLLTILGFIQKSLSVPDHFKSLLEELSGSNLRFSANINAPFFYIKIGQDGTFTYEGFHAEIVAFIAKALNITYSFVYQNVTEANKIGLMESAINQLMRNEVDVVAFAFAMNEGHCKRMDCSTPINALVCVMMVPWPETESRILVPLKPFQLPVWLSLLAMCAAMMFALVWLPGIYLKFINGTQNSEPSRQLNFMDGTNYGNAAVYIITVLLSQGNWPEFKQLSFRIMIGAFCLTALVLDNAYSSTLISYLTVPTLQPITKSLDDLASRRYQNLSLLTQKNEPIALAFLEASSGPAQLIGNDLRSHQENLFTNPQQAFDMFLTGKFAYIQVEQRVYPFLYRANQKAGRCKFTISNVNNFSPTLFSTYSVYSFKKTGAIQMLSTLGCSFGENRECHSCGRKCFYLKMRNVPWKITELRKLSHEF